MFIRWPGETICIIFGQNVPMLSKHNVLMNTTSLKKKKKKRVWAVSLQFSSGWLSLKRPQPSCGWLSLKRLQPVWDKFIIKMFWTGWHLGHRVFHSSSWGRIIETFALAQTFTIEPRPRHWQNFMFVFNPPSWISLVHYVSNTGMIDSQGVGDVCYYPVKKSLPESM